MSPVVYRRIASSLLPVDSGKVMSLALWNSPAGRDVVTLEHREAEADGTACLVRVHSECITGDVLGSVRCDCGPQLAAAIEAIGSVPWGIVVYMLGHEGRGIGLANKIRAYALQDDGLDTFEANEALGLAHDLRRYTGAAQVLTDMGATTIRLLTRNPFKVDGLTQAGIVVAATIPMDVPTGPFSAAYLARKLDWFRRGSSHPDDRR